MALSDRTYQTFESTDGTPLASLRCHICTEAAEHYVLWRDIENVFEGVDHLKVGGDRRPLFMSDNNGKLWLPLRIQHMSDDAYVVIYNFHQTHQNEGWHHIQQENDNPALITSTIANTQIGSHVQDQMMHDGPFERLRETYEFCKALYEYLANHPDADRVKDFLRGAANARYYHSMAVEEFQRQDQVGVSAQVDRRYQRQILEELHDCEERLPEWDYQNVCWNTLNIARNMWDYVPSTMYIVLPSDLDSWDDTDLSTHQFRLYFLCDNWKQEGALEDMYQQVHISNHPGYIIKRTSEFFHVYGDYLLRILRMIKHGYSDSAYEMPPLDTFKILWNCDPDVIGNHLTKDTIGSLVDKAIAYLQELSLPTRNSQLSLTRQESVAIKIFLDVHEGDDIESKLSRLIVSKQIVLWMCQLHVCQRCDQGALENLKEFVFCHGGNIVMHHSTLSVNLGSSAEADQFLVVLTATNYVFDVTLKLGWRATRSYIKDLCLGIAKTGTASLEIDGVSLDIHHHGHVQYFENLFCDAVIPNDGLGLQFITLLNYPRPQEQCIHLKRFSLQSALLSTGFAHSWVDLSQDLEEFRQLAFEAQVESDCNTVVQGLQAVLDQHGLSDVTEVTICNGSWDAVFDRKKGLFVEAFSRDTACPRAILTSGSLLRLTVYYVNDGISQEDLIDIFQPNAGLEELNISYRGHDVLYHIDHVTKIWHQSSSSVCLTLLDRMEDTQGRMIAQLANCRGDSEFPSNSPLDVLDSDANPNLGQEQQASDNLVDIQFMYWDCDHIFSPLSDYSASFLDMATQQHRSVLTLLALDTSQVSHVGLASVQNVLGRSSLEHLHILCTPYDRTASESITQILGSVQWLTLKSLILSGDNIDEWIRLWPLPIVAPHLMRLQIRGAEPTEQQLSHASALFVLQLVYANPLLELHLKHIHFEDKRDWDLIAESMDLVLLKALGLVGQ